MKNRHDYVSNSSSSSFIVLHRDNKYKILLQDPTVLSLRDYVFKFLSREIFPDFFFREEKKEIDFVSAEKFAKQFGEGKNMTNVLPDTARDLMDAYAKAKAETDRICPSDEQYAAMHRNRHNLKDQIMEEVYKALELKWKNEKFDYEEVDDNNVNEPSEDEVEDDVDYEYVSGEDYVRDRIDYVSQLKGKPLFCKIFSNH